MISRCGRHRPIWDGPTLLRFEDCRRWMFSRSLVCRRCVREVMR